MTPIAVVIPVRNRARCVLRTLDSVAASASLPAQLIVVDNGSADGTLGLCRQWARDNRHKAMEIRVVEEPLPGAANARNRGLREVSAPYVAFFDSDDLFDSRYIAHAQAAIDAAPTRPDLIFAPVRQHVGTTVRTRYFRPSADPAVHILTSMLGTASMLFRTAWLRRLGAAGPQSAVFDPQPAVSASRRLGAAGPQPADFDPQADASASRRLGAAGPQPADFDPQPAVWDPRLPVWQDWELGLRVLLAAPRILWLTHTTYHHIIVHPDSITGPSFSHTYPGALQAMAIARDNILRHAQTAAAAASQTAAASAHDATASTRNGSSETPQTPPGDSRTPQDWRENASEAFSQTPPGDSRTPPDWRENASEDFSQTPPGGRENASEVFSQTLPGDSRTPQDGRENASEAFSQTPPGGHENLAEEILRQRDRQLVALWLRASIMAGRLRREHNAEGERRFLEFRQTCGPQPARRLRILGNALAKWTALGLPGAWRIALAFI